MAVALKIHRESLLNSPLVRQALFDRNLKLQARGVDADWYYQKAIPMSVSGFNPFLQTYFFPQNSLFAEWMRSPQDSARKLNEGDFLVKEVFFFVHDYMHVWAYQCIHALMDKHRFGSERINKKNFEDYVFFHLLSEAVATVGVDYWYLSAVRLNDVFDIGSSFSTLTVAYREANLDEYRRFNPAFEVQNPGFFELLTRFYCDGIFPGFDLKDMQRSPRLLQWLRHELAYGETQREYARSWFSYLSVEEIILSNEQLQAPVSLSPWRKELVREVGRLLWAKIKGEKNDPSFSRFETKTLKTLSKGVEPDFRFLNLNTRDARRSAREILSGRHADRNFKHFFYQYVSQHEFASFDQELLKLFPVLIEKKDFTLIESLFKNQKRITAVKGEPEHLFILN